MFLCSYVCLSIFLYSSFLYSSYGPYVAWNKPDLIFLSHPLYRPLKATPKCILPDNFFLKESLFSCTRESTRRLWLQVIVIKSKLNNLQLAVFSFRNVFSIPNHRYLVYSYYLLHQKTKISQQQNEKITSPKNKTLAYDSTHGARWHTDTYHLSTWMTVWNVRN